MWTCVARSCVRNGNKSTVRIGGLTRFHANTSSPGTPVRSPWAPRAPLADIQRNGFSGRPALFASGASRDVGLGPSPTGARSDLPPEDFGTLSADLASRRWFRKSRPEVQNRHSQEEEEEDDDDEDRTERVPSRGRNTPYWYFLQCKKLIKEKKIQEALDLFNRDMLKGERLQPEEYNYTILIGACGRAGHLKKAFKLYNDMKKRGLVPTDATYTALFNACAETPWKQTGLQHALHLEQELRRKNYPLSTITYHALLKTHAVTNHLQACLHTLREMLQSRHVVTQETFHYLLMGCLKDKEKGFLLALQVWRQMLRSGIRPDSKNYNLLLRTARDCGIGDSALATQLLLTSDPSSQDGKARSRSAHTCPIDIDILERQLFIESGRNANSECNSEGNSKGGSAVVTKAVESYGGEDISHVVVVKEHISPTCLSESSCEPPNILDLFERRSSGAVVSLSAGNGASDRLALIGGGKGFLGKMISNGLSPDLKTLTLLADTMDPGKQSLQVLLQVAKQHKVKLDVAFFNSVIRRAAKSGDLDAAKDVLHVMRQRNVNTDVQTYGSLALGCNQQKDGLQLLKDMEEARLRPNVHVLSALIGRAARRLDYVYLKTLLKSMTDMQVFPNEVIIKQLEFATQYPPGYDKYKSRNNYLIHIDGFRGYYQQWLRSIPAQSPEAEQAGGEPESEHTAQPDGRTGSQRNQQAAARRYHSKKKDKQSLP